MEWEKETILSGKSLTRGRCNDIKYKAGGGGDDKAGDGGGDKEGVSG